MELEREEYYTDEYTNLYSTRVIYEDVTQYCQETPFYSDPIDVYRYVTGDRCTVDIDQLRSNPFDYVCSEIVRARIVCTNEFGISPYSSMETNSVSSVSSGYYVNFNAIIPCVPEPVPNF